jgi:hypothetical protein
LRFWHNCFANKSASEAVRGLLRENCRAGRIKPDCFRGRGLREEAAVFKIVIFVHAISSGWHDSYIVDPAYSSFELCETARSDLTNDFRLFLQIQHLQPIMIESKCMKGDDDV